MFKPTFTEDQRGEIIDSIPTFMSAYERLLDDYRNLIKKGNDDIGTMKEMRTRFNSCKQVSSKIKTALVYYKSKYDDRACSAKRARITGSIIRGDVKVDGIIKVTKSDAEKWAAAESDEYTEFLSMKDITSEAFSNILSVREDLQNYINDITGRINTSNKSYTND